jgi:hypothetical protein
MIFPASRAAEMAVLSKAEVFISLGYGSTIEPKVQIKTQ